jgi:hypothetical protein
MSNDSVRGPFSQGVIKSKQNKPDSESIKSLAQEPSIEVVKRYISLRIYRAEPFENGTYPVPVEHLEAGQHYRLVLQCGMNKIDADQQEITINGPFKLYLECLVDQGICPFTIPQNQLDFIGPFALKEIHFALPHEDCPSCNVTFKAKFVANETIDGPIPASCHCRVKGNFTPANVQWLATRYIANSVPKNTIVLSAEPTNALLANDPECLLTAWNHYNTPFNQNIPIGNFSINVGKSVNERKSPAEILHNLKLFSRSSIIGSLVQWIITVKTEVEKRGKQLTLVVFDKTHFEIPWELLEIGHQQYLGAIAQVARWLELDEFGIAQLLNIEEYVSEGSVVSYLDHGLEETGEERILLQTFVHSEMSSLEALQDRLGESLQDVGLLYIGSHGSGGIRLFSSLSGSNLQASWLIDHLLPHSGPRPTLFLNACESARILYKREMFIDNFVKNFLLLCASNYIGTIANVNSEEAPKIANHILQLAREDRGIQVVELLRRLRANAVKSWMDAGQNLRGQKETGIRQQLRDMAAAQLLNTFLYVYYGNPLARLHLHPAQDAKENA